MRDYFTVWIHLGAVFYSIGGDEGLSIEGKGGLYQPLSVQAELVRILPAVVAVDRRGLSAGRNG
jgi:hypothetical protein